MVAEKISRCGGPRKGATVIGHDRAVTHGVTVVAEIENGGAQRGSWVRT
jgi:hypothetical protein